MRKLLNHYLREKNEYNYIRRDKVLPKQNSPKYFSSDTYMVVSSFLRSFMKGSKEAATTDPWYMKKQ